MAETIPSIRCQRCGEMMELKDPVPGEAWKPDRYWVCPGCGRHFWSTYPSATPKEKVPAA